MSLLKMPLQDLNPHILCVLCGGYLVDATTIIECLHSFCRSCIVKYLQSSFHCPVCDAEVHKTKPLLHIRPDRPLQDIVNKLVPGLLYDELVRRREYEAKINSENTENTGDTESNKTETDSSNKTNAEVEMEDPVYVTLEYYRRKRNWNEKQVFPTRYLRCPSAVTVSVLKKFLIMKFAIPNTHQAELVRSDELLSDSLTMKEVSRIYGLYSKSFLDLQYSFLDVHDDNAKKNEENDANVPRKKFKMYEEENRVKHENVERELEPAPSSSEAKFELNSEPVKMDSSLDEHLFQNNLILPTFPETPPSFEHVEPAISEEQFTTSL